jgi:ribosomal protein S3AE
MVQKAKVVVKRKKFIEVDAPIARADIELVGENAEALKGKTIKLDMTRQLRGKSIELTLKVDVNNNKAFAFPIKLKLMPYFIRRMIRKRTTYVEDSFTVPTQQSMILIKPFLITRKVVSNAVRRTIRNQTKNWLEDYLKEMTDEEVFDEILSNRLQKPLSLKLKKTYPLSLCEIRVLEIVRPLRPEEVPKLTEKKKEDIQETKLQADEFEEKKIEKAEEEIKQAQEKAEELQKIQESESKSEEKDSDKKPIQKDKEESTEKKTKKRESKKKKEEKDKQE